jgi:hypothetical protein
MHEPFYKDYVHDDLAQVATSAGFRVKRTERAWLAKVVTASKPQRA